MTLPSLEFFRFFNISVLTIFRISGASELVKMGCTAIAVVVRFPEDEEIDSENNEKGPISVGENNEINEEEVDEAMEREKWQTQLNEELSEKADKLVKTGMTESLIMSKAQAEAAARFQAYRQGEVRTYLRTFYNFFFIYDFFILKFIFSLFF